MIMFSSLALAATIQSTAVKGHVMKTRWTETVSRTLPHPEYPRPSMVRKNWVNLNGQWDFHIETVPGQSVPDRKILVPFPVESYLSGINEMVPRGATMIYHRKFSPPKGGRVLLHFGAVDWSAEAFVNGRSVGKHKGGYDAFTFDVTDAVRLKPGEADLVVRVQDPTDTANQPRGKQVSKPGGIFYRPTSGIWQTVWAEGVSDVAYIASADVSTTIDGHVVAKPRLSYIPEGNYSFRFEVFDGGKSIASESSPASKYVRLAVPRPKLWSPDSPTTYRTRMTLTVDHKVLDQVEGHIAFREIRIGKNADGKQRILLNGKPLFLVGPLDQGFWPDGLYTAPTDAAMKYDIDVTKRLGFNMIRKHVKVEPETWYDYCDRVGIVVLQDMPSGSGFINGRDPDMKRNAQDAAQFQAELKALIDQHRAYPCIGMWVVFNEGWGQHDTEELTNWVKKYDPTRLVNNASGWTDRKVGDVIDMHNYPGPGSPQPEANRAAILGEFGGLGLPVEGHTWQKEGWGYQSFKTAPELTAAMADLFRRLRFLIGDPGCSAAVYTQTTDVETELNGLMTYDRAVLKVDEKTIATTVKALFGPPPTIETIVPASDRAAQTWLYTTDSAKTKWSTAPGPFGTTGTPGIRPRTTWNTADIWLKRTFTLDRDVEGDLAAWIYHDEDVEVRLDGKLVVALKGYASSYGIHNLTGLRKLTKGEHVIEVHCHQTTGGQGVDVGLVRVKS